MLAQQGTMVAMTVLDIPPPTPQGSRERGLRAWPLLVVVAFLAVVAVLPVLPAQWRTITHLSLVSNSGADEHGAVQVESCTRGALHFAWTCRGQFSVNDSEAEPYPPTDDVTVVNDWRFHARGTWVDATKSLHSHEAVRWGTAQEARAVALLGGAALCVVAAGSAVVLRGRRVLMPAGLLLLGVLMLVAGRVHWPDGNSSAPPDLPTPMATPSPSASTG